MVLLKNCPLCGSEKHTKFLNVKDFSTSKEVFSVVSCEDCKLLFTNPRPEKDEIGAYYNTLNYISHTNQKAGLFGLLYQNIRKRALAKKLHWIEARSPKGRLLDYGSGTGEFLNHCQSNGWHVKGVELADGPRENSIKDYGLTVYSPGELNRIEDGSVDVVTMWHVLEHVEDLLGLSTQLTNKIVSGGRLVLALPNPESWDAKHYKEYWAAWDVPIHFYHFKKKNIELLAEKLGLVLEDTINLPYDSYYISLLSEEYKYGRKRWFNASINGFKSNLKGKDANASSLAYVLRKN